MSAGPLASADLSVKLFVADPSGVDVRELIPVFHRWIQQGLLEDELAIDVTGYAHVPEGPGVLLICDTAHYSLDMNRRPGLRYRRRRRAAPGTPEERLRDAFRRALSAARLLDEEPGLEARYRVRTDKLEFTVYDRLHAPSTEAVFHEVRPSLDELIGRLYEDDQVGLRLVSGPREPFTVSISASTAPEVSALLDRLERLEPQPAA